MQSEGRYIQGEEIALKRISNRPEEPGEVVIPAGDYGIVQLHCENGNRHKYFSARRTERGNVLTGEGAIYERPIATFSVRAGEFVDVGSLQLPTWRTGNFFGPDGEFKAHVVPMSAGLTQRLATAKPALYAQRVERLMTVPGQKQRSVPAPAAHNPARGEPLPLPTNGSRG